MASVGLDANNLADNLAIWWITAWEASEGRPVDIPADAYFQVKLEAERALGAPVFSQMKDVQKQEMADYLAIQALVIAANLEHAKTDPVYRKELSTQIKKIALSMKLDLSSMTLTENGFVPAKQQLRSQ